MILQAIGYICANNFLQPQAQAAEVEADAVANVEEVTEA